MVLSCSSINSKKALIKGWWIKNVIKNNLLRWVIGFSLLLGVTTIYADDESVIQPLLNSTPSTDAAEVASKAHNTKIIHLYRPNYILPYYYTNNPYHSVYKQTTPNNQMIKNEEFKGQISLLVPIINHLFKQKPLSLNFSYTQLMYWQVYAKSQYFRETNYEPELLIENYFSPHWAAQMGVNHQSNGRGGILERSWNRFFLQLRYANNGWLASLRGWALMNEKDSSDVHNPDIARYLGYENLVISHNVFGAKGSVELQNIESGLKRGYVQVTLSYPIFKSLSLYGQFFNGYGQSMLEYNHRSTSAGIGLALNDWLV